MGNTPQLAAWLYRFVLIRIGRWLPVHRINTPHPTPTDSCKAGSYLHCSSNQRGLLTCWRDVGSPMCPILSNITCRSSSVSAHAPRSMIVRIQTKSDRQIIQQSTPPEIQFGPTYPTIFQRRTDGQVQGRPGIIRRNTWFVLLDLQACLPGESDSRVHTHQMAKTHDRVKPPGHVIQKYLHPSCLYVTRLLSQKWRSPPTPSRSTTYPTFSNYQQKSGITSMRQQVSCLEPFCA